MFAPVELLFSFSVNCELCELQFVLVLCCAFSDLTLLFGDRMGIQPVKTVMGCWCGYLSAARCRLAYGSEMTYIVSSGALNSTPTNQLC